MAAKGYCQSPGASGMSKISVDIDEAACAEIMRRFSFETKREAINFALRVLAGEPLSPKELLAFQGIGWDGDLDEMRSGIIS